MRYLRRNQVADEPTDLPVIADGEGRYDNTATHREAIRSVVKCALLKMKRSQILDDIDQARSVLTESELVKHSLTHRASVNRWSQEIIWSSVFVGFIFDFLLWQDIFTGRFDMGALSTAAERASAVVCSLAYAYVCSQLGIAAFLRVSAVRRKRDPESAGDHIERAAFSRAISRASLSLWAMLFVLLTGVSTMGRFTQDGTVTDHTLLTFVSVAIALVIAVMAFQYHDIYTHDLRAAKSSSGKAEKKLNTLNNERDVLDVKIIELSLNASLLSCSCGRQTCPIPMARDYLELAPSNGPHDINEAPPSDTPPAVSDEAPIADEDEPAVVEEVEIADAPDTDDVVMLKQLPQSGGQDTEALASELLTKNGEIESLTVENKYWKSKARQYKAKHARLDELVTRLVNAVLEKGSEPMFYRTVARHRREWESLWGAIDKILVEYGDGAPTV